MDSVPLIPRTTPRHAKKQILMQPGPDNTALPMLYYLSRTQFRTTQPIWLLIR